MLKLMGNEEILGQMWEDLQNMSEAEKKDYDKRLSEKLRLIDVEEEHELKKERMKTDTLVKLLDFWSQKSKEDREGYLRKSDQRRMLEIEERARQENEEEIRQESDEATKQRIINSKYEELGFYEKILQPMLQKNPDMPLAEAIESLKILP